MDSTCDVCKEIVTGAEAFAVLEILNQDVLINKRESIHICDKCAEKFVVCFVIKREEQPFVPKDRFNLN